MLLVAAAPLFLAALTQMREAPDGSCCGGGATNDARLGSRRSLFPLLCLALARRRRPPNGGVIVRVVSKWRPAILLPPCWLNISSGTL